MVKNILNMNDEFAKKVAAYQKELEREARRRRVMAKWMFRHGSLAFFKKHFKVRSKSNHIPVVLFIWKVVGIADVFSYSFGGIFDGLHFC